jgi:hypothetical protein
VELRTSERSDEPIVGYYLIEANDLDEATRIASQIPDARSQHITSRPLLPLTGIGTRTRS